MDLLIGVTPKLDLLTGVTPSVTQKLALLIGFTPIVDLLTGVTPSVAPALDLLIGVAQKTGCADRRHTERHTISVITSCFLKFHNLSTHSPFLWCYVISST
jgi:hypothetical protein